MSVRLTPRPIAVLTCSAAAALVLGACTASGGSTPGSTGASPASSAVGAGATVTGTAPTAPTSAQPASSSSVPGTPTASDPATSTPASGGTALATTACRTWKTADGMSEAQASPYYDRAAASAKSAAATSSTYARLGSDMGFVASLPLTSNSKADIAKARAALPRIASTCSGLGVPGIRT